MGPPPMTTESRRRDESPDHDAGASMGPPSDDDGKNDGVLAESPVGAASMGPPSDDDGK